MASAVRAGKRRGLTGAGRVFRIIQFMVAAAVVAASSAAIAKDGATLACPSFGDIPQDILFSDGQFAGGIDGPDFGPADRRVLASLKRMPDRAIILTAMRDEARAFAHDAARDESRSLSRGAFELLRSLRYARFADGDRKRIFREIGEVERGQVGSLLAEMRALAIEPAMGVDLEALYNSGIAYETSSGPRLALNGRYDPAVLREVFSNEFRAACDRTIRDARLSRPPAPAAYELVHRYLLAYAQDEAPDLGYAAWAIRAMRDGIIAGHPKSDWLDVAISVLARASSDLRASSRGSQRQKNSLETLDAARELSSLL